MHMGQQLLRGSVSVWQLVSVAITELHGFRLHLSKAMSIYGSGTDSRSGFYGDKYTKDCRH